MHSEYIKGIKVHHICNHYRYVIRLPMDTERAGVLMDDVVTDFRLVEAAQGRATQGGTLGTMLFASMPNPIRNHLQWIR